MNPRITAVNILQAVINNKQSLSDALPQGLSQHQNNKEHSLIKALCFGVCRWYFQLQAITKQLVTKPLKAKDNDIHILILLGLYQLQHMRIPPHAAVSETVACVNELQKPWAKGLVNAVLRNFQRQQDKLIKTIGEDDVALYAHPDWIIKKIKAAYPDHWQTILNENNQQAPMSLRVNLSKISRDDYLEKLKQQNIIATRCEFNDCGIVLEGPVDVDELPDFQSGFASVQDCAAQLAASLLNVSDNMHVLDACSAPGGKSAHLFERNASINLTAIEQSAQRIQKQQQTFERLQVTANSLCADAAEPSSWWDNKPYDRILLDAPCSASGVIRRHPDIKLLRQENDIDILVQQQQRLLNALWPLLKPKGLLLYATCSIFPEENHQLIEDFLQHNPDAVAKELRLGCGHQVSVGRQIFPGENAMDGFYYALLEKASH